MQTANSEKLWMSYYNSKDSSIKEKIIENYIPLIKHIVNRLNINLPPYLEYEDLISFGVFGLLQAIERYDANKGVQFETYAYSRIKGSIIDELRKIDFVPQGVRKKAKLLQNAFAELEQLLGRSVSDEDICNHLNITMEELYQLYSEVSTFYNVLAFDDLIGYESGQASNQPEVQAEKQELKKILGNAINKLQQQERLVITLYYYEGLNFKEIAKVLDVSQGRVSQLHTKAILRLRGHLSRKEAIL